MKKKNLLIFMFICWLSQKKKKYEDLKLTKLKFHITRNPSLVSLSTIEGKKKKEKKRALRSSFVFTNKLSLVSLSIVLHGTQVYQAWVPCGIFSVQKSTSAQVFIFIFYFLFFIFIMKLECLKLDLHSKLEFHELEFQKRGILLLIL